MRQDKITRAVSTGPAFLLLLLVTAGLFTMHTLGHSGPHDSSVHSLGMAVPASAAPQSHMTADSHVHTQFGDEVPSTPLPFGSLAVCMAVLATAVVLAIAALLSDPARHWIIRLTWLVREAVDMVRGPPGAPIGLQIADLSVVRN